jgi:hypothetical protein
VMRCSAHRSFQYGNGHGNMRHIVGNRSQSDAFGNFKGLRFRLGAGGNGIRIEQLQMLICQYKWINFFTYHNVWPL